MEERLSELFELRVGEMSERVPDERGDGVLTISCGPSYEP